MQSLNAQPSNALLLKETIGKSDLGQLKPSLDVISPYNKDPFISHFLTPISASRIVESYLENLPAYKVQTSPLLRGITIGFAHGYFLFGPFAELGPLRDTQAANFIGFIASISVILLLSAGLVIYGVVSFNSKNTTSESLNFLSASGWHQLEAGFVLGGFGGTGMAYVFINYLSSHLRLA